MDPIKVFWMERADLVRVSLRRYTPYRSDAPPCSARPEWGCNASVVIVEDALAQVWKEPLVNGCYRVREDLVSRDDPRWPAACEYCGGAFTDVHEFQVNAHDLYSGAPDGSLYHLREMPVGAMWDAHWLHDCSWAVGPDGIALMVKTPGGEWSVDGQASNCTRDQFIDAGDPEHPNAKRFSRNHYCWIRHGDPRTGDIHVDKNGVTCDAGAGSIIAGGWHGFLHNGSLVTC